MYWATWPRTAGAGRSIRGECPTRTSSRPGQSIRAALEIRRTSGSEMRTSGC
ncbi:hypothetical protein DPMN_076577 [Dreissena polymorpha]|uniref:Uncharacterized protein n=1 Tax=Dreissena polymorpha TaxID=45954 RepID=A0A9D3YMH3_DREPO|nr:hypothetical protein DPMN_076523 [Dreissena polymorpha]KAH3701588.1 hypothetical protein DPMN_076577 [Dreissena polymorpha]